MWTCYMSHHPTMLLFSTCQVIKFAWIDVPYILHKRGMSGKCLSAFWGTIKLLWTLYQNSPHFTHRSFLSWVRHKNMQPFEHECMTLYTNLNLFNVIVASYSMPSNVFGYGNKFCFSKHNSSFKMHLWSMCFTTFIINSFIADLTKLTFHKMGFSHVHQLLHNVWYGLTLLLQLVLPYLAMLC
jgi:hypothetical protein